MRVAVPTFPSARRRTSPTSAGQGPRRRTGHTTSFQIGDLAGTLTTSTAGDGTTAARIDLRVGTHGTTLAGLTDALATAASLALQHGAPLPAIADEWQQTRFVPHGATDDADIAHTTSLADYVARRLTLDFSPTGHGAETTPRGDQIVRR
jgi:ribonucleoside-diphosphate reductase alpha chain